MALELRPLQKLSPLFLTVGSVLVHLYLYNVTSHPSFPIELLFLGVMLQSVGMLTALLPAILKCGIKIDQCIFLLCVLILSFSMAFTRYTRFDVIAGSDIQGEFRTALAMSKVGRWDPSQTSIFQYVGTLSVTIFPMIISEITQLSITDIFRLVFPGLIALLPLFSYVVIRRFLEDSPITYLSTAMMPQIFFFTGYLDMLRSVLATISLLLILCIVGKSKREVDLVAALLCFGIVFSHYTVGYVSLFVFSSFLLLPKLFYKIFKKTVHSKVEIVKPSFLTLFVVIFFSWLMFVYVYWTLHLQMASDFLSALVSAMFERSEEVSYVFENPRGPLVSVWFNLQFLLMGVGAMVTLLDSIRGKIASSIARSWMLVGCSLIGLILMLALLPKASLTLDVPRVLMWSLPWLAVFMAVVLLKLSKVHLTLFVIVFLILMLPMNMMLVSHENDIMYHPSTSLTPERLLVYYSSCLGRESGIEAGKFIETYLPSANKVDAHVIGVDNMGGYPIFMGVDISIQSIVPYRPMLDFNPTVKYLVVHDLYLNYGLWAKSVRRHIVAAPVPDSIMLSSDASMNWVFNNGGYCFLTLSTA